MNTRGHEGLEWFRSPERNTLLHCAYVVLRVCVNLSFNVVCLSFYSLREAHTRMLSPDMWA
jgi:hypothetical protein